MSKGTFRKLVILAFIIPVAATAVWTASCNNSTAPPANSVTGTITTSLTDPPTCGASFDHVWVTVTKATAHISSTAGPTDSGWVTLVDLASAPKQIDLLNLA